MLNMPYLSMHASLSITLRYNSVIFILSVLTKVGVKSKLCMYEASHKALLSTVL
jgi:hypothetical protein